jgi:hypothetical protein
MTVFGPFPLFAESDATVLLVILSGHSFSRLPTLGTGAGGFMFVHHLQGRHFDFEV